MYQTIESTSEDNISEQRIVIRINDIGIDDTLIYSLDKNTDEFLFGEVGIGKYELNPLYGKRQDVIDNQGYAEEEGRISNPDLRVSYNNEYFNTREHRYIIAQIYYDWKEPTFYLKEVCERLLECTNQEWLYVKKIYQEFLNQVDLIKNKEKALKNK